MWAYSNIDDLTRVMEYGATLSEVLEAWAKYGDNVAMNARNMIDNRYADLIKTPTGNWRHMNVGDIKTWKPATKEEAFLAESGLRQWTREEQKLFYDYVDQRGRDKAARWLAANAAQTRLFRYGQANQVGLMRGTVGRLYGQFGIWPQWYLMYLGEGLARGTATDRLNFAAKLASVYAGIYGGFKAANIDPSQWLAYPASLGIPSIGPLASVTLQALLYGLEIPKALRQRRQTPEQELYLSRLRRSYGLFIPNYSLMNRDILPALEEYGATGDVDVGSLASRLLSLPRVQSR
jgi:hypothetical protein